MERAASEGDVVDLVFEALGGLNLDPVRIPRGRTDELRGGAACFDLKLGASLDAAIVLNKLSIAALRMGRSEAQHRVDYAIRGTIRGVLPGRVLIRTMLELKGLLRRRVAEVRWEIPREDEVEAGRFPHPRSVGRTPGPGELWEGGPHQTLAERLNGDVELTGSILAFGEGWRGDPLAISVVSDGWGASIRIIGSLWVRAQEILETYASPAYLGIADRIGGHIKEVRRSFGGLTF